MTLQCIAVSCPKEININELRTLVQNAIANGSTPSENDLDDEIFAASHTALLPPL